MNLVKTNKIINQKYKRNDLLEKPQSTYVTFSAPPVSRAAACLNTLFHGALLFQVFQVYKVATVELGIKYYTYVTRD